MNLDQRLTKLEDHIDQSDRIDNENSMYAFAQIDKLKDSIVWIKLFLVLLIVIFAIITHTLEQRINKLKTQQNIGNIGGYSDVPADKTR
jgi:hypothetical protein